MNVSEEGKWLLAVTSFEKTNSNFNITNRNNSFSNGKPGFWRIPFHLPDEIIDRLKRILKLRSENDIELHVKEVGKRGTRRKT